VAGGALVRPPSQIQDGTVGDAQHAARDPTSGGRHKRRRVAQAVNDSSARVAGVTHGLLDGVVQPAVRVGKRDAGEPRAAQCRAVVYDRTRESGAVELAQILVTEPVAADLLTGCVQVVHLPSTEVAGTVQTVAVDEDRRPQSALVEQRERDGLAGLRVVELECDEGLWTSARRHGVGRSG
jgi:hypothetical protein